MAWTYHSQRCFTGVDQLANHQILVKTAKGGTKIYYWKSGVLTRFKAGGWSWSEHIGRAATLEQAIALARSDAAARGGSVYDVELR